MQRRNLMLLAAVSLVGLGAAGCGGDDASSGTTPSTSNTTASSTTVPSDELSYPTTPDALLVSISTGYDGALADLMIGGDGMVYVPDELASNFAPPPGPDPQPVTTRKLTPDGLDAVMQLAADHGLLGDPPEYEDADITDQAFTTVTLRDDRGRYEHSAYALGSESPERDEARRRLDEFVTAVVTELESVAGDGNLGNPEPYVPEQWHVSEHWAPDDTATWPFDVTAALGCVTIDGTPPESVPGNYRATIGGEDRTVAVVPAFPWTDC